MSHKEFRHARDYWRKKTVRERAGATDRTDLDAARNLQQPQSGTLLMAGDLRDGLAATLAAAGWPITVESQHPESTGLRIYAGPATISVERQNTLTSFTGDEHPDDPDTFDLTQPLVVIVWAPLVGEFSETLGRVLGVDAHEIATNRALSEICNEVDTVVGQARQRDHADFHADVACSICGDRYPAIGLFRPTESELSVCPCCAFDGDLLDVSPGRLTFEIDRAASGNLAIPAAWSGVQALLTCLGGNEFRAWLEGEWRQAGTTFTPREWWGDMGSTWIWLPTADQRPPALAGLGCGAALAHVTAAIDRAHPDLRDLCKANRAEEIAEFLEDDEEDDLDAATLERMWPAAVAYAVALLTQRTERAAHRRPWHVLESFELFEWVEALESDLDEFQVESILGVAIPTILRALDPADSSI